jgi:hypothetical protein
MVILMPLPQEVKDIIGEMLKIQQILRSTSPDHSLEPAQRSDMLEAISRSEAILANMKQEDKLR